MRGGVAIAGLGKSAGSGCRGPVAACPGRNGGGIGRAGTETFRFTRPCAGGLDGEAKGGCSAPPPPSGGRTGRNGLAGFSGSASSGDDVVGGSVVAGVVVSIVAGCGVNGCVADAGLASGAGVPGNAGDCGRIGGLNGRAGFGSISGITAFSGSAATFVGSSSASLLADTRVVCSSSAIPGSSPFASACEYPSSPKPSPPLS